jgi:hypothetical protein
MVLVSAHVPPEGSTVLDVLPISLVLIHTWHSYAQMRL